MTPSETIEFVNNIGCTEIYVVCPLHDLDAAEEEIKKINGLGYAAFLRSTALGNEIVVTDKNGAIRSTRVETP
jgi:NAD-dependent dihydropyrimidine dehydrogenase PreA subunit